MPNLTFLHRVNLKTDQTLFSLLSFLGSLLFLLTLGFGLLIHPWNGTLDINFYLLLWILLGLVVYVILHEAIHVLMMKLFSKEKITLGFNLHHAFAGMKNAYFTKRQYTMIALAPSVLLGITLLVLAFFWFNQLSIYLFILFLMAQNWAGSVGDFYVVEVLWTLGPNVVVNDDGLVMSYFLNLKHDEK